MSNYYDQSITLDVSGRNNGPLIFAKQGDKNTRRVHISLVQDGVPYSVGTGQTVELRCTKPSGYSCDTAAVLDSDGSVVAVLPNEALTEHGMVLADIAVKNSSEDVLSTTSFYIRVMPSAGLGASQPSNPDAPSTGTGTGVSGATFVPSVDSAGNLSWTNDKGLANPATVNIRGPKGEDGADGSTPEIGANGNWFIGGIDTGKPSRGEAGGSTGGTAGGGSGASEIYYGSGEPPADAKIQIDPDGDYAVLGAIYTPSVDPDGNLSWSNDEGLPNPEPVNIKGKDGETPEIGANGNWFIGGIDTGKPSRGEAGSGTGTGVSGATFVPSVDSAGNLSWTNDKGLANPSTVNIRGPKGKDGADGEDGYTPVKGTDYFTNTEVQTIVELSKREVLAALPTWTGGTY